MCTSYCPCNKTNFGYQLYSYYDEAIYNSYNRSIKSNNQKYSSMVWQDPQQN